MGDIDGLSRGFAHFFYPSKEYKPSNVQRICMDKLFSNLDPSIQNNLRSYHEPFVTVVNLTRELSKCV